MALPVSTRPIPMTALSPRPSTAIAASLPAISARAVQWAAAATLLVATLILPGVARADAELAKSRNCMACHSVEKKLIGPSYKDVAAKYAGSRSAVEQLARKIREGGVGTWGQIPMPANPQVSAEEGTKLATWILNQK